MVAAAVAGDAQPQPVGATPSPLSSGDRRTTRLARRTVTVTAIGLAQAVSAPLEPGDQLRVCHGGVVGWNLESAPALADAPGTDVVFADAIDELGSSCEDVRR